MARTIRFIHAADLHLGAPIRGLRNASPEWAARLQRAIVEAYDRVIDAALSRQVDFVVLAGDTFDTSRPSYDDYLRFFEGLAKLHEAGIPAYLVAGNHDPYTTWARDVERLPPSARLLGVNGPEFALFTRDDEPLCLIGGRSYYNQSWPDDERIELGITREAAVQALAPANARAAEAPFMVGVIHTGINFDLKKAPSDPDELLAQDVDYWACGHLHKRFVRPSESDPRIVFPGCVQARDIKEGGERGCYLVELTESGAPAGRRDRAVSAPPAASQAPGPASSTAEPSTPSASRLSHAPKLRATRAAIEFVPAASVVLKQMRVDVSACQTLADVSRLVQAELFRENGKVFSDEMVVRVTLEGKTALHGFLMRGEILEDLRKHINNAYPSFFCDALVDKTLPADVDSQASEGGGLFPSLVADMADEQRGREDVLINYVQSEFVKRGIAIPSALSRRVSAFNDEAERLVLDLLRKDDE